MADNQQDIDNNYALMPFRFMAKIGDTEIFFSEISGLSMDYQATEYREATAYGVKTTQLVGQRNSSHLTLKRGWFKNGLNLYKWLNSVHAPDFKKKDVVITMLDDVNRPVMVWTVTNAFATRLEGPGLDAKSNEVSFQTLEIKGDLVDVKDA